MRLSRNATRPEPASLRPGAVRAPRTIAVASGKGGVGKTCCTVALATTLARAGHRVLLVDADLGLANVDVQLGLAPAHDIGDVLDGMAPAEAATRYGPGGFDVLPGRAGSGALASLAAAELEALLLTLANATDHDLLLLDLGAGVDRTIRRIACWADTLVVLTTEEPTALTDAYVLVKLHLQDRRRLAVTPDLAPMADDVRVVVNLADDHAGGERTFGSLARVCGRFLQFEPGFGGVIRRDERMRDAIRQQQPLSLRHPLSPAAADLDNVARGLTCGRAATPAGTRQGCRTTEGTAGRGVRYRPNGWHLGEQGRPL